MKQPKTIGVYISNDDVKAFLVIAAGFWHISCYQKGRN